MVETLLKEPIATTHFLPLIAPAPAKKSPKNYLNGHSCEAGKRVTLAEYWQEYYKHPAYNYEFNNGILEVVPVTKVINFRMYYWYLELLHEYLKENPIAKVIALETGFHFKLDDQKKVRKPDLGLVLHTNRERLGDFDLSYHGVCDMCIEVVSDSHESEKERDLVVKKEEYQRAGVKEYFIFHHDEGIQYFYRLNAYGMYEPIPAEDGIIRSEVLPGFQFRLSDLNIQPDLDELAFDEVYRHFVGLKLQAERRAKQLAEKQAQQEYLRAEREHQAKRLAEKQADQERQAKETAEAKLESYRKLLQAAGIEVPDA